MTEEVRRLFVELADLGPEARQRVYDERDTPGGIRREVESLLGFDGGGESFTGEVALAAAEFANAGELRESDDAHPRRIGPYTIERILGRGGMGVVYLARRVGREDSGLVALKRLHATGAGAGIEKRFLQERRILGWLQHPGIAQMIDAGQTDSGEPYLVMEYVAGASLDEFCRGRSLAEIVRLFIGICETLSFAHRNLVIHRDLKPSNIVVNGEAEAKLLDFGIAKILSDSSLTVTLERALTPEFASPEQLRGEPQTVATDIYSLGAVLKKVTAERIASGEQSKDLEAIIGMATREEARDRYSSADVLAADLRALLEHRVVEARRGSTAYTVRRFFRRHWVSVSAGSVTVAALAAGLLVAHAERAVAERRFNEVRQLSKELFDLDGEISALPGSTQARHKLVSTSLAYLERLRPDALQDRSLALEIGSGYLRVARAQGVPSAPNLGQAEEAERSLGKARELLNLVRDAEPENREALLLSLQIAQDGMILAEVGRREAEAKSLGRETISLAERLLASGVLDGGEAAPILATFANVSLALSNLGEWAESAAYGERCGSLVRMKAPRIPAGVACQSTSANAYRHLGRLDEALAAIEEAGEMLKHVEFAGETQRKGLEFGVLWRRGVILGEADAPNLGRDKEAIASLRDAYSMMEEIARRDRAETSSRIRLSTAGRELAEILVKTDPAGALAIRKHCLSRLAEVATGRAARTAEVWHLAGSAEALRKLGDVAEAERSLAQAFERLGELGVYPVLQGRLADEARFALRTKAEHLAATGRTREAVRTSEEWLHLEAPLAEQRTEQLPLAFRTWSQWLRLAEWNRALGRTGEAEEYYQQAVVLWGIWKAKLPQNQFVAAQSRYFEERSAARR